METWEDLSALVTAYAASRTDELRDQLLLEVQPYLNKMARTALATGSLHVNGRTFIINQAVEAADLLQSANCLLLEALDRYDPARGSFKGFLYATAAFGMHRAIGHYTHEQQRDDAIPIIDKRERPEDVAYRRRLQEDVSDALTSLHPRVRAAVIGRVYDEKSFDEIGKEFHLDGDKMPSIYRAGIKQLYTKLYRKYGEARTASKGDA